MPGPTVSAKQGVLRGAKGQSLKGDKFFKFLGIPYGKPPIGDLRFKAPLPAGPWCGERDGSQEGSPCLSQDLLNKSLIGDEDCLFLNVFTRSLPNQDSPSNLKPVMVFIHGGAFTMGSSTIAFHGPEVLMNKDIVLVTLNYRIGVLGFLSLDDDTLDVPGNAGLKDQVLALKWVQENISSFGGDPGNVTIFGVSAGGASVHLLVLSPAAKGLFHKAIAMSGSALNPWARGSRNAKEIAELLGKDVQTEKEVLDVLTNATAKELIQASLKITDNLWDASRVRPFGPVVEHPNPTAFITKEPHDIIASGEYNHVPFMTGFTSREGLLLGMFRDQLPSADVSQYFVPFDLALNDKERKLTATKIHEQYLNDEDGIYDLASDVMFVNGIVESVVDHVKTSTLPVYLYQISSENKLGLAKIMFGSEDKPGVGHGDEMGLIFNMTMFPRDCQEGSLEEKASDRMVASFVNFAKHGDPTPSERELGFKWRIVAGPTHLDYLDFGDEPSLKTNPFPERIAFWEQVKSKKNL